MSKKRGPAPKVSRRDAEQARDAIGLGTSRAEAARRLGVSSDALKRAIDRLEPQQPDESTSRLATLQADLDGVEPLDVAGLRSLLSELTSHTAAVSERLQGEDAAGEGRKWFDVSLKAMATLARLGKHEPEDSLTVSQDELRAIAARARAKVRQAAERNAPLTCSDCGAGLRMAWGREDHHG